MTALASPPDSSLSPGFVHWKKAVLAELKGVPFEKKLVSRTFEDIALQPLYTQADLVGLPDLDSGPSVPPFLRGTQVSDGRRRWQIAQEISSSQPGEYNRRLLANLRLGQDAVVLTADTRTGESGLPNARTLEAGSDATGHSGVCLNCLQHLADALATVDLQAVPFHLTAGGDPRALAALYLAFAQKQKLPFASLAGSVTGDPLGEAAESGHFPGDLGEAYDGLADWTRWAAAHAPKLQTIGVNAAIWGAAGATATQELALALAGATDYLRALLARHLPIDVTASRIRFRFSIGPQFFMEIAKFRAFRLLWSRVLASFEADPALASTATVAAVTGQWNKTLLDPHVNLLRTTTEALSAVLGGCDSLQIAPFDEVSGKTTDVSRRIALNLHTLLAEEFGFAAPADPAGGSWYVEKLTDQVARSAWTQFQDLEHRRGLAACLRTGYAQAIVEKSRAAKAQAVAQRRIPLVGTNLFPNLKEAPLPPPIPPETFPFAAAPLRATEPAVDAKAKALEPDEVFPAAIKAATRGASVNELRSLFRASPALSVSIPALKISRAAEGFEALRRITDARAAGPTARPKVFLAKMGPSLQHKARSDFSAAFFSVGGFEVVSSPSSEDPATAASAAVKSGAPVVVLCSTDETYPTLAPLFAQAVKAAHPRTLVVLAGLPTDPALADAFRAAGFDEFIHARANVEELLASFLQKIGAAS